MLAYLFGRHGQEPAREHFSKMGNEYETLAIVDPARSARSDNTEEAKLLIDEFKALGAPVFVLTGGDPVKRPDIFELVEYTPTNGVRISLTPSATPLLTHDANFETEAMRVGAASH